MTTSRREILKAIPAAALVAAAGAVPAGAIPPVARSGKPRLRLGLAGYSMRDHLHGEAAAGHGLSTASSTRPRSGTWTRSS